MKMPNDIFFHIGYHKTATTWMQGNLFNKHSEIIYLGKARDYSVPGVIDIFHSLYEDSDTSFSVRENQKKFNQIENELKVEIGHKIIGFSDEGLSGGIDWFGGMTFMVADRIKAVFSNYKVKIIIGIREQVSMVQSFYSEYVKRGGTNSLKRLIYSPFSNGRFLLDKLEYYSLIRHYYAVYGKENVYVYLYEEFKEDQEKVVAKLLDFLEINDKLLPGLPVDKKENRAPSRLALFAIRTINSCFFSPFNNNAYFIPLTPIIGIAGQYILTRRITKAVYPKTKLIESWGHYRLEQFLSNKFRSFFSNLMIKIDHALIKKSNRISQRVCDGVKKDFINRYHDSNTRLGDLIEKDLSQYDYI